MLRYQAPDSLSAVVGEVLIVNVDVVRPIDNSSNRRTFVCAWVTSARCMSCTAIDMYSWALLYAAAPRRQQIDNRSVWSYRAQVHERIPSGRCCRTAQRGPGAITRNFAGSSRREQCCNVMSSARLARDAAVSIGNRGAVNDGIFHADPLQAGVTSRRYSGMSNSQW